VNTNKEEYFFIFFFVGQKHSWQTWRIRNINNKILCRSSMTRGSLQT